MKRILPFLLLLAACDGNTGTVRRCIGNNFFVWDPPDPICATRWATDGSLAGKADIYCADRREALHVEQRPHDSIRVWCESIPEQDDGGKR